MCNFWSPLWAASVWGSRVVLRDDITRIAISIIKKWEIGHTNSDAHDFGIKTPWIFSLRLRLRVVASVFCNSIDCSQQTHYSFFSMFAKFGRWKLRPAKKLTYLLTYSMVQSPSWEAHWFAASQEIPRILWNPKVHYRTHKRPPPVPILGQPSPVHIPTSHLLEIHPNIIHTSTPRSP